MWWLLTDRFTAAPLHREEPCLHWNGASRRMTQDKAPIAARKSSPKHSYWGIASLFIAILLAMEVAGVTSLIPGIGTLRLPALVAGNIGEWSIQAFVIGLILAIVGLVMDKAKIFSILSLIILVLAIGIVALTILGLSHLTF